MLLLFEMALVPLGIRREEKHFCLHISEILRQELRIDLQWCTIDIQAELFLDSKKTIKI